MTSNPWSGKHRLWCQIALVAGILPFLLGEALAGLTAFYPFCLISDDGSRVLVNQGWDYGSGKKALDRDGDPYAWCPKKFRESRLGSAGNVDLLRDFPSSGVYTLPDRKLIYPIHGVFLEEHLIASPDLSSLVLLNRTGESMALAFLENGKVTRTYRLEDLLLAFSDYKFRTLSTNGWYYPWHDEFKRVGDSVVLTTEKRQFMNIPLGYYERHQFDFKTGHLQKTDVFYGSLMILPTIGGLLLGFGMVALVRRTRNRGAADRQPA